MKLDVIASGMVTPVGYTAASSCGALRCGIDGFRRTRFKFDGAFVTGAVVPWEEDGPLVGKLAAMSASVIDECVFVLAEDGAQDTAIALCLPEAERPGRISALDATFLNVVLSRVARPDRVGPQRQLFQNGAMGAVQALLWADEVLERNEAKQCLIVGVDSYLNAATLSALHSEGRLLTTENSDGFIPGEAAAGVLVTRTANVPVVLECRGIGWGREDALPASGKPLRADGLAQAYRAALKAAGCGFQDLDYRLSDVAGEEYSFKEAALGLLRTMRARKESFEHWHPADCVGRVGAASVPLIFGVALDAVRKYYAPGPGVLCHFADDMGARAAAVLRMRDKRPALTPWYAA